MSLVAKVARGYGAINTVLRNARWLNPAMEIVYRDLFLRDLKRLGIPDDFYPIGSAANHGLLYADHDLEWAQSLRQAVSHEVVVASLVPKTVCGYSILHYADGYFDRTKRYDFVVVDGPSVLGPGSAMSRLGCLEIAETALAQDFIVILDDAERKGEGIMTDLMRSLLKKKDTAVRETSIVAAKRQHIFCGGKFESAMFF